MIRGKEGGFNDNILSCYLPNSQAFFLKFGVKGCTYAGVYRIKLNLFTLRANSKKLIISTYITMFIHNLYN